MCAGINTYGGHFLFSGSNTVTKNITLPSHAMLKVQFQFWKFDDWWYQYAYLRVDGLVVWGIDMGYYNGYLADVCRNSLLPTDSYYDTTDMSYNVEVTVPHN